MKTAPSPHRYMSLSRLAAQACFCTSALLFASCVQAPLGLSKEQWAATPVEKQADYQAQQTQIDEARAARASAAALERQRLAQEAAMQQQEQLQMAYAGARYGDIITVTVSGGMVAFSGKRYPYEPVAFDLVRGETKRVQFVRQGRSAYRTEIEMRLSDDGNTFYFDVPARKRVVLINQNWDRGRRYNPPEIGSHDGHSEAIGVTISVQLKKMPIPTRRVIIDRR